MRLRNVSLVCLVLTVFALSAGAQTSTIGAPADEFFGCDPALGFHCSITLDELGHISWSAPPTGVFGEPFSVTVGVTTPTSNPAWVDSTGAPLEVISYFVDGVGNLNTPLDFIPGVVGLCEFGISPASGLCTNGDLSDVLIFTSLGNGHNRIDFLSDNENVFNFLTDFNILEVDGAGPNGQDPTSTNGAVYQALGVLGGGEGITYNIVSDGTAVPEPSSLILLGTGLLGAAGMIRRKLLG